MLRNELLDQHIAERIGTLTRFPSLTLAVNGGGRGLSWTGTGVAIPPQQSASELFNQLFERHLFMGERTENGFASAIQRLSKRQRT